MDKSVYIIEDDAHSLAAICNVLRELQIHYKRNTTGAAVVEKISAMETKPDVIMLDLDLPEADAFEIVRAVKNAPDLHHIPVIAMADDALLSMLPQTRSAGFSGFIPKPFPRRQMGDLLGRVFAGQQVWAL